MARIWAGVDAGKTHHHCVAIDENGKRRLSRRVANDEPELLDLVADVLAFGDEIVWAVDLADGAAGLLIALLVNHDQHLLYIPGRVVNRAADGYRGEGKTDAKDAAIIADQARVLRDLHPLRPGDELTVELGLLTAHRFPSLERELDLTNVGPLVLLTGYQTPAAIRRVGARRLETWLRNRKVRGAAQLAAGAVAAAERQHTTVPGEKITARLVHTLAREVMALNERIADTDKLVEGRFREHEHAVVIASMPGIGPLLGAELLAATGGDMAAFATPDRLAAFAGVAPAPRDSGKVSGNLHRPQRYPRCPVPCPVCGVPTGKVHGYHRRTVRDVPVDGRRVVVRVRIRPPACPALGCCRRTFRKQVPGLLERHQRRTARLTGQLSPVVKELCGRASARLTRPPAVPVSYATALRLLRRIPVPAVRIPRVAGVDDFALRRRHRYATIIIDAETGERIEVPADREAATLELRLREHPGIEAVCRDGSPTYAEAIRRALPDAIQISDRRHLRHNLCDKVPAEVRADTPCRATVNPPRPCGTREQTTRERRHQVHQLLDQGVGLLDCPRRLDLALNTVKRHARIPEPTALRIAPQYRPTLVDPHRDHLRRRRAEDPAVPVTHLLRGIRESGYTGSANLLVRYPNQGRAEGDRPVTTPRRATRLLLTHPDNLRTKETALMASLAAACPEMAQLSGRVSEFAELPTPAEGNDARLTEWITQVCAAALPHLQNFCNGLELDRQAVVAGLTLPYHNGRTEGVNTRTKRIMRQMHGRAGFDLLRHRILLQ